VIPPVVVRVLVYVATVVGIRLVGSAVGMIFGWADRRLDAPIMRERINSGSDDFFAKERLLAEEAEQHDFTDDLPVDLHHL
jgi:hypothetical protein